MRSSDGSIRLPTFRYLGFPYLNQRRPAHGTERGVVKRAGEADLTEGVTTYCGGWTVEQAGCVHVCVCVWGGGGGGGGGGWVCVCVCGCGCVCVCVCVCVAQVCILNECQ